MIPKQPYQESGKDHQAEEEKNGYPAVSVGQLFQRGRGLSDKRIVRLRWRHGPVDGEISDMAPLRFDQRRAVHTVGKFVRLGNGPVRSEIVPILPGIVEAIEPTAAKVEEF